MICAVSQTEAQDRPGGGAAVYRVDGGWLCGFGATSMGCAPVKEELKLKNRLKEARQEKCLSQAPLANLVGVSRNTISSIETGQFNPTAKLALILRIALEKKFEELFYF